MAVDEAVGTCLLSTRSSDGGRVGERIGCLDRQWANLSARVIMIMRGCHWPDVRVIE